MHLVMEFAGGGELYHFVKEKGRLNEDEAKAIFVQLAAAVSHMVCKYMHELF